MGEADKVFEQGGPAFPVLDSTIGDGRCGMSLRDWFAGMAMQGLLAGGGDYLRSDIALDSYRTADAMLAARNKLGKTA